jgi:hypothetical protein
MNTDKHRYKEHIDPRLSALLRASGSWNARAEKSTSIRSLVLGFRGKERNHAENFRVYLRSSAVSSLSLPLSHFHHSRAAHRSMPD